MDGTTDRSTMEKTMSVICECGQEFSVSVEGRMVIPQDLAGEFGQRGCMRCQLHAEADEANGWMAKTVALGQANQQLRTQVDRAGNHPKIVCLCGSTRFSEAFRAANLRETLAGRIVLTIGCDFKSDDALGLTLVDKTRLDELHLRKIDMADEVLVLDVDGYIGESTSREIAYATAEGKLIRYLHDIFGG